MLLIEFVDVTVRYRRTTAARGVTFSVGSGIHALLGPNGAGKSTLMSVATGMREPTSGTVTVDGRSDRTFLRRTVGLLPQDNLPRSRFTVEEFLHYIAWLNEVDRDEVAGQVETALDTVSLQDHRDSRIRSLSGGTRRRAGIAAALIGDPKALLLDEPSAGLDITHRRALSNALTVIAERIPVLMSTHIVDDVAGVADAVTVLSEGAVKFTGSMHDFTGGTDDARAIEDAYLSHV
ncbi:ATP-binding cassette domain-containing protein [Corynebacterium bovis]|uniref:Multidrug ABC transporter ATP-binding protein n=1 Tax=Corynebacterium bovis TaxID=36808 RepID=A0A426Q5L5_9CORY|nr:ATP-binding cassette domain-containing protein [Corynebacterium bovis]RRO89272.1 multidrug ABC transporter ATP-binding protein [Corynebacterium bovis]RRO95649.1 multidrug ABC transporter ATP-binding protein [Corynebacterium bovis]RRO97009.1 multidrug ABC transporter ATP-binding protein [Corynebacterium bovis]RRQ00893.1 multidrug ABC transporter ATP-binding protein [Corynebacterium bovis]RRQ02277.1 multidrug ABC transporter ATP-binding protein [Corynebacterium bovis]